MNWFYAIRELCSQLDSENTIKDILRTAVDESMLTSDEAEFITKECHLDA